MSKEQRQRKSERQKKISRQEDSPRLPDDLLWGINPVLEYITNRPAEIKDISILKTKHSPRIQQLIDLARDNHIKVNFVSSLSVPEQDHKITHQGVMARTTPVPTLDLEALLERISTLSTPPLLLALDSIQDPHNLGAIIRSASAAGVDGIILPRDRTAPLSGTAAKVAAGSMSHVNICLVTNLARALEKLKEHSVWICGSDLQTETVLYDQDLSGPLCLVIGSEGKGLRPLVKQTCDFTIKIPMLSGMDSLNASVATGIMLFEAVRQRRKEG